MNYSNTKSITKSYTNSIELVPTSLTGTSLTSWLLSELDNLVWLSYCKLWGLYTSNCVTKSIDNFKLIKVLKGGKLIKIQSVGVLIGSKSFEFYFNILERNEHLNEWEFVGDGFMTYVLVEGLDDKYKNSMLTHPSTLLVPSKLNKLSINRKSLKSHKMNLNNQFNWDLIRNSLKNDNLPANNACYSTLVEAVYPQNVNGDGTGFGGQLITWMSINSQSTIRLKFPNFRIYFKGLTNLNFHKSPMLNEIVAFKSLLVNINVKGEFLVYCIGFRYEKDLSLDWFIDGLLLFGLEEESNSKEVKDLSKHSVLNNQLSLKLSRFYDQLTNSIINGQKL